MRRPPVLCFPAAAALSRNFLQSSGQSLAGNKPHAKQSLPSYLDVKLATEANAKTKSASSKQI